MTKLFNTIEDALEDIRRGQIVIVLDDEDRENEGDFVMASEKVTPQAINLMATHGRGLICVPITKERASDLDLPLMTEGRENQSFQKTAFTISVDARAGGTGISAEDRTLTVKTLVDPSAHPRDLLRPGHCFPLVASSGGVLERNGHTEAAVDLARLAGLFPSGVICEIAAHDGSMARRDELLRLASELDMKIITIKDLIEYRKRTEDLVEKTSSVRLPNAYGDFELKLFQSKLNPAEHHLAYTLGDFEGGPTDEEVLVRIHSECLTGDVLGSMRCDCGEQLQNSLKKIAAEGKGAVIYLRQEGRGIGLVDKIRSYELQDQGHDTVEANHQLGLPEDMREYYFAVQILKKLGISRVKLITNNPHKLSDLKKFGIEVVERVALDIPHNIYNKKYLETKRTKMGHFLSSFSE